MSSPAPVIHAGLWLRSAVQVSLPTSWYLWRIRSESSGFYSGFFRLYIFIAPTHSTFLFRCFTSFRVSHFIYGRPYKNPVKSEQVSMHPASCTILSFWTYSTRILQGGELMTLYYTQIIISFNRNIDADIYAIVFN